MRAIFSPTAQQLGGNNEANKTFHITKMHGSLQEIPNLQNKSHLAINIMSPKVDGQRITILDGIQSQNQQHPLSHRGTGSQ